MAEDFYLQAWSQQVHALDAQRQQALADLASHRASGDTAAAAETIQQIADIDTGVRNLAALHDQYRQVNAAAPGAGSVPRRTASTADSQNGRAGHARPCPHVEIRP